MDEFGYSLVAGGVSLGLGVLGMIVHHFMEKKADKLTGLLTYENYDWYVKEIHPDVVNLRENAPVLGGLSCLLIVFAIPIAMVAYLAGGDPDDGGGGAALLLLLFFFGCGLAGATSGGLFNETSVPTRPKPPAYVDKNWQHSPGGIETQKFEGGYDGRLNKEFEGK